MRWIASQESDIAEEDVEVNVTYLGGGFGRRGEPDFVRQAVALALAVPGRPVKLMWSREEDMQHDTYRPAGLSHFRVSVDPEGYPLAWHNKVVGPSVSGQATITRTSGHRRVRLEPGDATASPEAVAALETADLVVLGPGSLFTSILPNLLVPGIAKALVSTAAPVVMLSNLREQPGETQGLDMVGHLDVLAAHVPDRRLDVLVTHVGPPPRGPGKRLVAPSSHPHVDEIVGADLLDGTDGHAPAAIARVLADLLT